MALLIEILHGQLKGEWPKQAVQIAQDGNAGIYGYIEDEDELVFDKKLDRWEGPALADIDNGRWSWYPRVRAEDYTTAIITREMYEAYLAALAVDWSAAPDHATHYGSDNGDYCEGFYQIRDGVAYYWTFSGTGIAGYTDSDRPIDQLIARPTTSEVPENDISNW